MITVGRSVGGALAYNEKKVASGDAVALGSIRVTGDVERQSLGEKTATLKANTDMNARTQRNSFHIALSFAPEDRVDPVAMRQIAVDYLKGIGFEGQPAYLYHHRDTANSHMHIVTTNIRRDGKRIDDSFIGATKSEETRKRIEVEYGLVQAESRGIKGDRVVANPEAALTGYARQIVGDRVKRYRPSSVAELNATLRADGLQVVEQRGTRKDGVEYVGYTINRVGAKESLATSRSVKASRVFEKGWSARLADGFEGAKAERAQGLPSVRRQVGEAFAEAKAGRVSIAEALAKRKVEVFEHRNDTGRLYGLHYADKSGHIYKASEVGRGFSAGEYEGLATGAGVSKAEEVRLAKALEAYIREHLGRYYYKSVGMAAVNGGAVAEYLAERGFDGAEAAARGGQFAVAQHAAAGAQRVADLREVADVMAAVGMMVTKDKATMLRRAGIERDGAGAHLVGDQGARVALPAWATGVPKEVGSGERFVAAERLLLAQVGSGGGLGAMPKTVSAATVPWPYWRLQFGSATSEAIGRQLHQNYVDNALGQSLKATNPAAHLAKRGVVVAPAANGGYRAYVVNEPRWASEVGERVSARLRETGHDRAGFARSVERLKGFSLENATQGKGAHVARIVREPSGQVTRGGISVEHAAKRVIGRTVRVVDQITESIEAEENHNANLQLYKGTGRGTNR